VGTTCPIEMVPWELGRSIPLIKPALLIPFALGGVCLAAPVSAQQGHKPDILVSIADALGIECLSAHGGGGRDDGRRSTLVETCLFSLHASDRQGRVRM
jgi:hypothetical protein